MSNNSDMIHALSPMLYENLVREALREDLGRGGDITSAATIPEGAEWQAVLRNRKPGVIAGLDIARCAFQTLDAGMTFTAQLQDGAVVAAHTFLATVQGKARALLAAERTALNFLCHLSGIATATHEFTKALAGTKTQICDTRKTTPGLRALEKYAVRCGGGINHRFGLDDAVLIKDNHIAVAGGIAAALRHVGDRIGHMVKVEIEVDRLEQVEELLALADLVDGREGRGSRPLARAADEDGEAKQEVSTPAPRPVREAHFPLELHSILLDNMPLNDMAEAVRLIAGRWTTVASGNVTVDRAATIAATGVDLIASGAITHSVMALDIGLDDPG